MYGDHVELSCRHFHALGQLFVYTFLASFMPQKLTMLLFLLFWSLTLLLRFLFLEIVLFFTSSLSPKYVSFSFKSFNVSYCTLQKTSKGKQWKLENFIK